MVGESWIAHSPSIGTVKKTWRQCDSEWRVSPKDVNVGQVVVHYDVAAKNMEENVLWAVNAQAAQI